LNQKVASHFYSKDNVKRWRGHRLVGVDGSKINLPYSLSVAKSFHPQTVTKAEGKTVYMGNMSQAFDLLNEIVLDASISSIKGPNASELHLALAHLDKLQSGDLILADRGYPGFVLFSAILSKGMDFCMRLSKSSFKEANEFQLSAASDTTVKLQIRDSDVKAKCRKLGYPTDDIEVRLLKVRLKSGETEILATSLKDADKYPKASFKSLYGIRWNIEESYKRLKHRINIENFSGKSVPAILQDFYAKVFSVNLVRILMGQSPLPNKKQQKRVLKYQVNWSHAIRKW